MRTKISKTVLQVVGLGILAGMRTMAAPVVASHILSEDRTKKLSDSALKFMQSRITANVFKVLAVGELIGDKLPATPNRIESGGLIGRGISGALAGASIFKASNHSALTGAILGSASAIGATFCCYYLRKKIAANTKISDPIIGTIEDSLVITSGIALIKTA